MSLEVHATLAAKQERWKSAQKESSGEEEKVETAVAKEINGHLPMPTNKVRAINGSPPDGEQVMRVSRSFL